MDEWLKTSDVQLQNLHTDAGSDEATTKQVLTRNRGANVTQLVEATALEGLGDGKPNVPLAKEYFEKYRSTMDEQSQIKLDGWLKSKTTQQQGDDAADAALAKAHGDHGAPSFTKPDPSASPTAPLPPVTADDGSPVPVPRPATFAAQSPAPMDGSTPAVRGHGYANSSLPAFAQAAQPGGLSPAGMAKVVQIESGGNPNARNGNHVGLVQAGPDYWRRFGNGSPLDPFASISALGKSSASDAAYLRNQIGRQPSDAELYLAHQQGAGGAAKLLMYPNARAGDLVGDAAIRGNMGNPNGTAAEYVARWSAKFGGASMATIQPGGGQTMTMPAQVAGTGYQPPMPPPDAGSTSADAAPATTFTPATDAAPTLQASTAAPAPTTEGRSAATSPVPAAVPEPSPGNTPVVGMMAAAFAEINRQQDTGMLSPESAQVARTRIHQRIEAQQVADESDNRGRKRANDDAADGYVSAMLKGDTDGLVDKIASDPRLTWETKRSLGDAIQKETSDGSREMARHYGQGFLPALKAINAAPDDPNRISDASTLLSHVGQGGDLTFAGYEKLSQMAKATARDVNGASENRLREHMYQYANEKMTYTIPSFMPGQPDKRDVRGTELFNAVLIPQVEAASEKWVAAGHSLSEPNSPISKKNIDALIETIRPKRQMDADRISALGQAPAQDTLPPAPPIQGLDAEGWKATVAQTPNVATPRGQLSREGWAKALTILATTPTPRNVRFFDQSSFGRAGLSGSGLVKQLTGLDVQAEPSVAAYTGSPTGGATLGDPTNYPRAAEQQQLEATR